MPPPSPASWIEAARIDWRAEPERTIVSPIRASSSTPGRQRGDVLERVPVTEPRGERVKEAAGAPAGVGPSVADEHPHRSSPGFGTLVRVVDDTIEALRSVAIDADDASGYFPAMYARVTDRIRQASVSGEFADPVGMIGFATAFADWYLRPRAGVEPIPGSWRAAWDVAGDDRLLIVQHLLLGINAHVNHDLGQVVVELADQRDDRSVAGMRSDFDAVNAVLAATMPDVLRDLGRSSRWVNTAAAWGAGRWFHFSLEGARDQAWRFAERTHPLDDVGRQAVARELDELVRVLAYLITRPVWPVRWLVPIGRRLEADEPRAVTVALLGHLA